MAVAELVVIRHGESLGNAAAAEAYASGAEVIEVGARDADVELSATGVEQAQALGRGLKSLLGDGVPTAVWSSTYVRAQQTAEISLAGAAARRPVPGPAGRRARRPRGPGPPPPAGRGVPGPPRARGPPAGGAR